MTEQQDSVAQSPDSVQTTATVAAVPQQQTVAQTAPVRKGQFEEQLAQLPDSIRQPLQKQLDLLPQSSVMKIVENHNGSYSILYKTYDQAKEAKTLQDSLAQVGHGTLVVPHAKAKLGSEYYTAKGDTSTFTMGSLIEFQVSGLIIVMLVLTGLCVLCYGMSALVKHLGLGKLEAKKAPENMQQTNTAPIAVNATGNIHPGLTNEQLAVIFAVSAAEILGRPCTVVRFRPQNANDWVWAVQGRVELHNNGLK